MTCVLKDRKTSALLWTGVDERKYPKNISETLMVKFIGFVWAIFKLKQFIKKIDGVINK